MTEVQSALAACPLVAASLVAAFLLIIASTVHINAICRRRYRSSHRTTRQLVGASLSVVGLCLLTTRLVLGLVKGWGTDACTNTDLVGRSVFFIAVGIWALRWDEGRRFPTISGCSLSPSMVMTGLVVVNVGLVVARLVLTLITLGQRGTPNEEEVQGSLDSATYFLCACQLVMVLARLKRDRIVNGQELEDPLLVPSFDQGEVRTGTTTGGDEEDGYHHTKKGATASPMDQAGWLSRLGFCWLNPLLRVGSKRQLIAHDIPPLSRDDATRWWAKRFRSSLDQEKAKYSCKGGKTPSILRVFHNTFGFEYYYLGAVQLLNDLLGFSGPVLLKLIVSFIQDYLDKTEEERQSVAFWPRASLLVLALMGCYLLAALLSTQYGLAMARVQLHIRTALISSVYHEVLTCRSAQAGSLGLGTGEVTNMMTVDTQRIMDAASSFNLFWSLPIQVGITLYLLYKEVSFAFVAGLAVIVLMIPINSVVAKGISVVTRQQMQWKDRRVQTCSEMLHGVRALKLFAWEDHMSTILSGFRAKEVYYLAQRKYLDSLCVYFWACTPVLTSLATFVTVALTHEEKLTPAAVFTTVSLLNMLIFPMNAFPWIINCLMEATVSRHRLERYLLHRQPFPDYIHRANTPCPSPGMCVEITGRFTWNPPPPQDQEQDISSSSDINLVISPLEERTMEASDLEDLEDLLVSTIPSGCHHSVNLGFELTGLNLRIPVRSLVGIYGKVGSGKSSLLLSLLGEMYGCPGSSVSYGSHTRVAYCSQVPWVQHGTIKDLILFGMPEDPTRYDRVLWATGLERDLQAFPKGDQTEVGERGATLSGGQRLRLALARAAYSHSDLYLLDDPFSGLDHRTATHVLRHCIQGLMRQEGATVVLVTHSLHIMMGCDVLYYMEGGRVVRKEVLLHDKKVIDDVQWQQPQPVALPHNTVNAFQDQPIKASQDSLTTDEAGEGDKHSLVTEEGREQGAVKWSVYLNYARSVSYTVSALTIFTLLGMQLSANAFTYWLSLWCSGKVVVSSRGFLKVSGIIAAINSAFTIARSFLFAYGGIRAARLLHDSLLKSILQATMTFFDSTLTGRILNRFSQDTYTVDDQLPFMLNIFLAQSFALLGTVIILTVSSPWVLVILAIVALLYFRLQRFYRSSSRELKRLDSVSRSPIYAHFAETLDGAPTVRAFAAQGRFVQDSLGLIDGNQRVSLVGTAASQWLTFRLQMFGLMVTSFVAALALVQCKVPLSSWHVNAGLVGLSLSASFPIVANLSSLLSSFTETEKELVAVERVQEYIEEPPEDDSLGLSEGEINLPPHWPSSGTVKIQDLCVRYRPGLPMALNHVCMTIQAGEKVALCGRTGAGKSTLISALFRLMPWEGTILLDEVPIKHVHLRHLRASMSIVPQDPTIFAGTVRSNLDPANLYSDDELLRALQLCHLDTALGYRPDCLMECMHAEIQEKGGNLSLGQRQLLCLGRVLLKRSKVLCVDEATASVDMVTDALVRRTISETFRNATVITVAHRLSTILEMSTRCFVFAEGQLVEVGEPHTLLQDPSSYFHHLHSGGQQSTS